MTPNLNDKPWLRAMLVGAVAIAAVFGWLYLAGGIFMLANHYKFEDATPLTLYQYWAHYREDTSVRRWLLTSAGLALAVVLAPGLALLIPTRRSLFGDARFAKRREIQRAGLFSDEGILVGRFKGRYLMFGGSQHVIMSAPTRSGKGVGIVVPNLLSWPDSVVVLDVKQENHAITSGYRAKHGQACFLFNPAASDYRTHRYNPLTYLSEDENFRIDDIQKIANMLFPDQAGTDVIWTATPRTLFLGVVLLLLETPGRAITLGQVLRETLVEGDASKHFASAINVRALGTEASSATEYVARLKAMEDLAVVLADKGKAADLHPRIADMAVWCQMSPPYLTELQTASNRARRMDPRIPDVASIAMSAVIDRASAGVGTSLSGTCVRALTAYISISSDNTRAGVMTSFRSRLELWNNPLVDAATSANDFDLRDVRKQRMSIYLGVTPDNLDRMSPLLNLFFQQLIDLNTRELPELNPALKYKCLLLPDEFTAMGKVGVLAKGIGYIAGYGLRMLPIIQSPNQLVEVYGKEAAQTFTTNHALQIVFPPKASELQTARDISEWLGYQTVKGFSLSKGTNAFSKRENSQSASDQRRALLLPQEITSLGKDLELIVVEHCPPILARKIRYFEEPVFVDRLKTVSASLRKLGKQRPTESQLKEAIRSGELAASVPTIDLEAHHRSTEIGASANGFPVGAPAVQATISVLRTPTLNDIKHIDQLELSAFAVHFSDERPPEAGKLDKVALHAYADRLCREAGIAT